MTPGGSETVIYAFAGGADGAYPIGLVDGGGTLYGTTFGGGNADCNGIGCDTVFKITTSGTETVLLTFANQQNYDFGPSTAPVSIGGVLYFGTRGVPDQSGGCRYGCGTIDSLTKKGTQSIVYSFKAGSDGAGPDSLIDVGGTLYGTTIEGGGSASCFDGMRYRLPSHDRGYGDGLGLVRERHRRTSPDWRFNQRERDALRDDL